MSTQVIGVAGGPVKGGALGAAEPCGVRYDWTRDEVTAIYQTPLTELVFRAQTVHRANHAPDRVQTCQLLSIKTGGCPEDCAYCPQSAHYQAGVSRQDLMRSEDVLRAAQQAKREGATRFCM